MSQAEEEDPHCPKTRPLESIDELLRWKPEDPFNVAMVDLRDRHPEGLVLLDLPWLRAMAWQ